MKEIAIILTNQSKMLSIFHSYMWKTFDNLIEEKVQKHLWQNK